MNLVKFILFGALLSTLAGAFGRYPFNASSAGVHLTDLLVVSNILVYITWVIITKSKIAIPKVGKIVGLFLLTTLSSLLAALTFLTPLDMLTGTLYLLRFSLYLVEAVVVYNLIKSKTLNIKDVTDTLIVSGIALAILGLIQLALYPNLEPLTAYGFDPHQKRVVSTLLDPNFTGVFLVITFGLILGKLKDKFNWVWLALLSLITITVVLTYSRSAYLMLIVFLLLYSLRWKRLIIFGLLGVFLMGAFLPRFRERIVGGIRVDASAAQRLESWNNGLTLFKSHPIFGVGFNNLRVMQNRFNLTKVTSVDGGKSGAGVDSGFLFVLSTTGAVGFLIYLYLWYQILRGLYKSKGKQGYLLFCLSLGLLVNGQFINSLFLPAVMLWFYSLLISDSSLD